MRFFSQRNNVPPPISEIITPKSRSKILYSFLGLWQPNLNVAWQFTPSPAAAFHEIGLRLYKVYGGQNLPGVAKSTHNLSEDVSIHFLNCNNEQALDFIEALFHFGYPHREIFFNQAGKLLVEEINTVFRDDGIGWELTKCDFFLVPLPPGATYGFGPPSSTARQPEYIEP
jgi:hypothetical protein